VSSGWFGHENLAKQLSSEYIVQGHRFNIFEGVGCYPYTWNTPLAYVLVMAPPLIIGVISGGYSGMYLSFFVLMSADKIASHEFHCLQEMPHRVQTGPILQL